MFGSENLKLGHSIFEFNSPGLGQIIGNAGIDFVFLDMEHSGFGVSETKRAIAGLRLGSVAALVRPPSNAYHHIARALDIGADGLVMPMVSSKEEAEYIVSCMKYPPKGRRGVALGIAHDWYAPKEPADALAAANRRTALATLIETEEGNTGFILSLLNLRYRTHESCLTKSAAAGVIGAGVEVGGSPEGM